MNATTLASSAHIAELKPLTSETIAALMQVTQDPIDGMRLAADFYTMSAYAAECALAERAGARKPQRPPPTSKFLRGFIAHLEDWLETMARSLRSDEIDRLMRIGEALALRLNDEPGLLLEELFTLVTMAPVFAVVWLRSHFNEIEAKVCS